MRQGDIIQIEIRDSSHQKIDTWKFNTADKELGAGILNHIRKKYSLYKKDNQDFLDS